MLSVCYIKPTELEFGWSFFSATVQEGLKLLFLVNKHDYSLQYGAQCCIASTVLWFVCWCMSCMRRGAASSGGGEGDDELNEPLIQEDEEVETPMN
mmetsp:Transcript_63884/g.94868  ORF Transcript_63884/g.94868 Transcript_63884/m.94868 type:complete len:96 (-) Transcript_63884:124-411(-)